MKLKEKLGTLYLIACLIVGAYFICYKTSEVLFIIIEYVIDKVTSSKLMEDSKEAE